MLLIRSTSVWYTPWWWDEIMYGVQKSTRPTCTPPVYMRRLLRKVFCLKKTPCKIIPMNYMRSTMPLGSAFVSAYYNNLVGLGEHEIRVEFNFIRKYNILFIQFHQTYWHTNYKKHNTCMYYKNCIIKVISNFPHKRMTAVVPRWMMAGTCGT